MHFPLGTAKVTFRAGAWVLLCLNHPSMKVLQQRQ